MAKLIIAFLILLFSVCIVHIATAGTGEPTSCYKWSYNHLDGYVYDGGNYWGNYNQLKQADRDYQGQQKDKHYTSYHRKLQINSQFVFSTERVQDKNQLAEKL